MMRTVNEVDGQVTFDNGDPDRPEYDPAIELPPVEDRVAELERRANEASAAPDLDSVKAKLGGQ